MFHRFANPTRFLRLSAALMPWTAALTLVLLATGFYLALAGSPADYQQGETVRIMYVHVPSAWIRASNRAVASSSRAATST